MDFATNFRLDRLIEAQKSSYFVYVLVNHTKKTIYFGITNNFPIRYIQHILLNKVKATKYWSSDDDIDHAIDKTKRIKSEASELAHTLEKKDYPDFPGYKVIQTSGI